MHNVRKEGRKGGAPTDVRSLIESANEFPVMKAVNIAG